MAGLPSPLIAHTDFVVRSPRSPRSAYTGATFSTVARSVSSKTVKAKSFPSGHSIRALAPNVRSSDGEPTVSAVCIVVLAPRCSGALRATRHPAPRPVASPVRRDDAVDRTRSARLAAVASPETQRPWVSTMSDDLEKSGGHAVVLERMPYDPVAWEAILEEWPEAEVFHGSAWFAFLAASQGAEPVVAIVREGGRPVGYFVGAIVRRFGLRILGSPLKGWSTTHMGFLLEEGADRRAAAEALVQFAFQDLGCVHVELADRWLTADQMAGSGFAVEPASTFIVDLTPPEEAILGRMRRTTRQAIGKGRRLGLRTEVVTGSDFADEFHRQLSDIFARQGLAPTYGVERVRQLIEALQPTGRSLLIRIRTPDDRIAATGITVGRNETAVAWGVTWRRSTGEFHPVDLLWWEMMRLQRAGGARRFDCGGLGDYKAKYGGEAVPTYRFHRSRYPLLGHGRSAVRRLVRARQRARGFLDRGLPGAARDRRAPADAETG